MATTAYTPADPKAIIRRYETLLGQRQEIDGDVQDILAYCQPQKSGVNKSTSPGVSGWTDGLYDMTANHANMVLAAGLMSTATPTHSRWAALSSPRRRMNGRDISKRARLWYQEATEEVMDEIGRSNFYTELHECHLDRSSAGTSCLFFEPGRRAFINFTSFSWGNYVICEDSEGFVDTVIREFRFTARQAVEKWGVEKMPAKIKEAYGPTGEGRGCDQAFTFLHAVHPRMRRDVTKQDGQNKPFASCYVCKDDPHTVDEGGFDEFPYAVSRYLKWPGTLWGFGPGFSVLPTVRQVNFIERQLDALAEKAAFPPVLVPSNIEGDVDARARGVTVFNENFPNAIPREWMTQGRYDIGKDRVEEKRDFIRKAFHNDLFQMFGGIDRDMTAFEAMQRANEKLDLISPAFTRLTAEKLSPVILFVFRQKLRSGALSMPPEELLEQSPSGEVGLREPNVVYTSKLALAIKAGETRALLEAQQVLAPMVQVSPEIMDNLDVDKAARGTLEALGVPSEYQRDEEEVAEMRAARAEAAQAQQDIANAQGAAKAAKDMSAVPEPMQRRMGAALEQAGVN